MLARQILLEALGSFPPSWLRSVAYEELEWLGRFDCGGESESTLLIGASEALSSSSGANTLREEIVSGLRAGALGT